MSYFKPRALEEYAGYQTWRQKAKTIADEVLGL